MKLSSREYALAIGTAACVLFGVSFMLAKPKLAAWKELRKQQDDTIRVTDGYRKLFGEKEQWTGKYDGLKQLLPQFPSDRKMDVHWMSTMDAIATRHGVSISRRVAGEEKKVGDVFEMPIECMDCEGKVESIVHFLFDLQSEGAMLDVRQLTLRPKGGGVLKGRFVLYCAYLRTKKL